MPEIKQKILVGVAGVALLTIIYLVSFLPDISVSVATQSNITPTATRAVHYLRNINTAAVIVYCILVAGFRGCFKRKLGNLACCLTLTKKYRVQSYRSRTDSAECILQDC